MFLYGDSMPIQNTTPVPNSLFEYMPTLTHAEIRVLLVVIRQTYGWKNKHTGERKDKDRLTYGYLIKKTGLYRTILSETIQSLVDQGLLIISDYDGTVLKYSYQRKGKHFLFYQFQPVRNFDSSCSQFRTELVRKSEHNKRKTIKNNSLQKEQLDHIEILKKQLLNQWKNNPVGNA